MNLLGLVLPPWAPAAGLAALVAASGIGGAYLGYRYERGRYDALVSSYATSEAKAIKAASDAAYRVGYDAAAKIQHIVTVTNTQIREVPKYVTVQADAKCDIPLGFVRLHDAAASGSILPESSPGDNDSASGIALSDAASTLVQNYGICREDQQRLRSAQDYIGQLKAAWPK